MWLSVVFFFLTIIAFITSQIKKPQNFPKGPRWLPVIGSAFSLKKARDNTGMLVKGVRKIADDSKISDLIGFKVGKDRVVFAFSTEALIEMLYNKDLDGRPRGFFFETRTWNQRLGIVLTDGPFWITQRRFIMRQLKDFGYGRKRMKEICETEMKHFVSDMRKINDGAGSKGAIIKLKNHFNVYISNTLWQLLAGKRYNFDDSDVLMLQNIISEHSQNTDMMGTAFSHFPFLRFIAPEMSGYRSFVNCFNKFHEFFGIEIDKHQTSFDPTIEPQNLIDAYLKMIYMKMNGEEVHESFTEKQLRAVILDLFIAGSETSNKFTNFMFLYLLKDTIIQDKAREEIDGVVGRNRLPTLEDRVNLPYCDAIVHEAFRIFSMFNCTLPRRSLCDTKLCGYDIPKNTIVVGVLNGMMTDKRTFVNVDRFDPGHFYKNGKFFAPENFNVFGLGQHRCIGDLLGKANSFLILTAVVQNFILKAPENHTMPAHYDFVDGITTDVRDFFARVQNRE